MEKTLKEILKWNYLNKTFWLFLIFFSMYSNNSHSLEIKDSNNNVQIKNERDGVIKEDILENYLDRKGTVDYLLGVGDRHRHNIMLTHTGKIFNIDFGW